MAPIWPVWVPLHRTTHTSETFEVLEAEMARLLDSTRDVSVVIATHDLLADVVAARNISVEDLATTRNWFFFLGLTEDPYQLA
jgi:UDP-N-acetylglucosamine 2-epimerase